jgi:transposase-like protein
MKRKMNQKDTPVRSNEPLVINAAQSWKRLQRSDSPLCQDLEDHFKDLYRQFLDELMIYDRQNHLQVKPYERQKKRRDQANGFYRRHLTSSFGTIQLHVPRTRSGKFQTEIIERYQRRTGVVDQAIKQVFLSGVSTRQTGAALAGLLGDRVSAGTVSEVSKMLDEQVKQWHFRTLSDHYEYLVFDGVSVRIRLVGQVKRRMVLCAYGITTKGKRELIDFLIVKAESEANWKTFLLDLHRRGLKGAALKLITTDGNEGLDNALHYTWPRAVHQRCWAHKLRNLENKLKAAQGPCLNEAKLIYQAAHRKEALQRFKAWKEQWKEKAPKAVCCLEEDLEAMLAFFDCPSKRWIKIRTTNVIERAFVEVRRRIRTMCSFTTQSSCERILYSVFERMNTNWEKRPL